MKFPRSIFGLFHFFWRWTKKLARPVLFALVCLVTLAALYITEENYRTGREWENYKAAAKARGVKFTIAELVPPPVPDDQNFAMTPLFKPVFADPQYEAKLFERLNFDVVLTAGENEAKAPLPDGSAWETGRSAREYWAATFHKVEVAATLNKDEADLAEISAAIQRPYAQFPFPKDDEEGASRAYVMAMISRYMLMLNFSKLYHVRAWFELISGKNPEAFADALTLLRLSQSLREYPFALSALTQYSMLGAGLEIAWEGMQEGSWTDAQLLALQREIQKIDFLRQLLFVEQGERASYSNSVEWFGSQDFAGRERDVRAEPFGTVSPLPWSVWLRLHAARFVFTRALLAYNAYFDQYVVPAIDLPAQRVHPDLLNAGTEKFGSAYLFGRQIVSINDTIVEIARAQTALNEAAVACALERYRLAHGEYPDRLDVLLPQYIDKLPHDLMTGGPLEYQRQGSGGWVLSATGWWKSSTGDNYSTYSPSLIIASGQWVWRHPAK